MQRVRRRPVSQSIGQMKQSLHCRGWLSPLPCHLEHAVLAASQDWMGALTDSPVALAGQAVAADCDMACACPASICLV